MPPRPLYKWKTLWLGILALAFLCWSWSSSMKYHTTIRVTSPFGWVGIGQHQGQAGLFAKNNKGLWSTDTFHAKLDGTIQGIPEMWKFHKTNWGIIVIDHFWIILAFTISWASFLTWRVRRMDRLPATASSPGLARSTT